MYLSGTQQRMILL